MKTLVILSFSLFVTISVLGQQNVNSRWTTKKANEWYHQQGWLIGANFTPSTAVNQLEMWQAATFDTTTINRELGYAEAIGFNVMRVYLHHVAWQVDSTGFKNRIREYLTIADKHGIKTMFTIFDDCWNDQYIGGVQPSPLPGIHNSRWLKDPGNRIDDNPALLDTLEWYVKDILKTFKNDRRVIIWDLYNEPGHFGHGEKSWPLLHAVVQWAREAGPSQPITVGLWNANFTAFNDYQLQNSDIISFHNYRDSTSMATAIDTLMRYGRPIICTEYMKRPNNSTFFTHLPMMQKNGVGAINWGLVAGKTQTNYPQGNKGGEPEPDTWYHDIFRKDGTPYDSTETIFIKKITDIKSMR